MPLSLESPVIWTSSTGNERLGRLCRISSETGRCCVMFAGLGCRRVREEDLRSSDDESAPACDNDCRLGC